MHNQILLKQRKITLHREITQVNWVFQGEFVFREIWFQEILATNKIEAKMSIIGKAKP